MNDRIDPIVDSQASSILDQPNIVDHINEEVAPPVEKTNPFKLLFNGKNKTLLFMLFIVFVIGTFGIVFAAISIDSEVTRKTRVETVERKLPVGRQTEARAEEIQKYNDEVKDEKTQPIALEQIAMDEKHKIDGSFDANIDSNIDPASGCGLADTACMRIKKRIGSNECAPQDNPCKTILAAKNSQDQGVVKTENKILTEKEQYLLRLKDKDYVSELSKKIQNAVKEKNNLVVIRGGVLNQDINQKEEIVDSNPNRSNIESGILKADETQIELINNSGDRLMGSAEIALNSKIEGEASFTVFGGKFIESRMLGNVKRKDDFMRVELHTWVLPDKRECKINAIALDKKTTYAAIASRVDHHVLYRYGWWGLGTVLGAVGKAAERNADKELIIVDGTVIESTTADSKREIRMAVGDLGTEIGKIMQRRIDTPSTVYVDINETVGIFFLAPVTTGDCKFGGINNVESRNIASSQ